MFKNNLKIYREKAQLSQTDIAKLLDLSQQGYSRYEQGTSFPNEKTLLMLCEILSCSPNDLLNIKVQYFQAMNKLK